METGTGKTITFLNTIYSLYKEYGLIKFIILVPSIAILENTKSAINNTKDFFKIKYETQLDFLSQIQKATNLYTKTIFLMKINSHQYLLLIIRATIKQKIQ